MPRIKEHLLCCAWTLDGPCRAPATRDGLPNCKHGEDARRWIASFAPKKEA